mmetsp:Transcript_38180/g.73349  ORF Transcript_38180/g.73349 Transcript_38180/m.73349 type:complete len:243 (-) Transcript_38180:434-1162(-)
MAEPLDESDMHSCSTVASLSSAADGRKACSLSIAANPSSTAKEGAVTEGSIAQLFSMAVSLSSMADMACGEKPAGLRLLSLKISMLFSSKASRSISDTTWSSRANACFWQVAILLFATAIVPVSSLVALSRSKSRLEWLLCACFNASISEDKPAWQCLNNSCCPCKTVCELSNPASRPSCALASPAWACLSVSNWMLSSFSEPSTVAAKLSRRSLHVAASNVASSLLSRSLNAVTSPPSGVQ